MRGAMPLLSQYAFMTWGSVKAQGQHRVDAQCSVVVGHQRAVFVFTTASRPDLGPTQPPIQFVWVVKGPKCEVNHSPETSAEVMNAWSYTSIPSYVFMACYTLKHRNNF